MKQHEKNIDELLGQLERQSPPPFLLTRIKANLDQGVGQRVAVSGVVMAFMSICLIVTLNIIAVNQAMNASSMDASNLTSEELATGMQLNISNQLYHD